MNTEHIEKFVNAIACDLEEGGFRQVSGTTLRRTLAIAVSAALPLLADTGIPASQPAELAEQQGDVREQFEAWWKSENYNRGALNSWHGNGYNNVGANAAWASWQAALAARQPVAVVGSDFTLLWAGSGPIAPIVERHGLKRGSLLYAAPPAQGIDLDALQGVSNEYNAWIYFHAAGEGDYDDFLRKHVHANERDAAPGVGNG